MHECECKGVELFKDLQQMIVSRIDDLETEDVCVALKNLVVCLFTSLECSHEEQMDNIYDFFEDCAKHLINCHIKQKNNEH